ncbi:MAG: glycerophosphodiester phosphodiesterase [Agathobacter sp.]|nr:glycerophosphodiester phosphodiesterase [Agathobacter sp.]
MDILWNVLILLLVLTILFVCMVAPRMLNRADRTPFLGKHYAHRGLFDNNSDAPENSLAAFKKAVDAGYGIELDVQLSKDNKLVVFHDATLKRMCGVEGKVWEYTLEELKSFRLLNSNEQIPTFEEYLEVVDGKVPFILEYKLDRAQTVVCRLANEVLKNYKGVYCIESFHPLALLWYRKNRPDVLRGQLCEEFYRNDTYKGKLLFMILPFMPFNFLTRPDFIAYNHEHAHNISRRICKALGGLSVAYTIKSGEEYERAKNKFDLFIFDSCRL